jgi:hypothetical protein
MGTGFIVYNADLKYGAIHTNDKEVYNKLRNHFLTMKVDDKMFNSLFNSCVITDTVIKSVYEATKENRERCEHMNRPEDAESMLQEAILANMLHYYRKNNLTMAWLYYTTIELPKTEQQFIIPKN